MTTPGIVHIVGAGPGDPELLTLKALRCLQNADVILYDRLIHPDIWKYIPAHIPREFVGKKSGERCSTTQQGINERLVGLAHQHQHVVRLKGGDPFVFGRGGEEALALAAAGVAFEVVPGISAAVAAPAAVGIPVTHRGVASGFAVFTGHCAESGALSGIDWRLAAQIPTAVFLMGVAKLPEIVRGLCGGGRALDTPVAVISFGTWHDRQEVIVSTLQNVEHDAAAFHSPATIVVGEVVRLREQLVEFIMPYTAPASTIVSDRSTTEHC